MNLVEVVIFCLFIFHFGKYSLLPSFKRKKITIEAKFRRLLIFL